MQGRCLLLVLVLVTGACAGSRAPRTEDFSRGLLSRLADGGFRMKQGIVRPDVPATELPANCIKCGDRQYQCLGHDVAQPVVVNLWRDGTISSVVLWSMQGPAPWTCDLFNSLSRDFSAMLRQSGSGADCACDGVACLAGGTMRSWRVGPSNLKVMLVTSMEEPHAPDGTAIAKIIITVAAAEDGGPGSNTATSH